MKYTKTFFDEKTKGVCIPFFFLLQIATFLKMGISIHIHIFIGNT